MDKGRINADELAQKLASARKIMKKVNNGDYEKGHVNENMLRKSTEELMSENTPAPVSKKPVAVVDSNRINQSKLPDNIKRAMIESPIPQIGLDSGLDMDFVEKARSLMEQDGTLPARKRESVQTTHGTTAGSTSGSTPRTVSLSSSDLERKLTPIIENVIRKTLDEIVDRKLTQLLAAQAGSTLNENLAIKVGDTIFTGKITKSKSLK